MPAAHRFPAPASAAVAAEGTRRPQLPKAPPAARTHETPQGRTATRLADVADDINIEWIKPAALATYGAFYLTGAKVRPSNIEPGKFEVVFDVEIADDPYKGATGCVSMASNPQRERMVDVINRRGTIGPMILVEGDVAIKGNYPWIFRDADDDGSAPDTSGATATDG